MALILLLVFIGVTTGLVLLLGKGKRALMHGKVESAHELINNGIAFTLPFSPGESVARIRQEMELPDSAPWIFEKRYYGLIDGDIPAIICGTKTAVLHAYSLRLVPETHGSRGFLDLARWQIEPISELMSHSVQTRATQSAFRLAVIRLGGTVQTMSSSRQRSYLNG